jgi:predicted PurR-regulated permease PerM
VTAVPPALERAAAYSWRLLVVGAAALAAAWAVSQLRLVLLPVFVAVLLAAIIEPAVRWLTRRRLPALPATWVAFLGFFAAIGVVGALVVPPVAHEFEDLGPTVQEGIDEVEDWLITGPLDLDRTQVADARRDLGDAARNAFTSRGVLVSGTVLVAEIFAGTVLAMVIAFFVVKDGKQLQQWALDRLPPTRRDPARAAGRAAWWTLGGYLRGAAILGIVEGTIIGITLALVGSSVVLPVAVLTFLAAFIPFLGAIVAGVVATLVALVAGGLTDAAVVAVVALVVQQLDNEVLAPFVYSRAVRLHPLVVVLAVATGATVAGIAGAFLAVPLTAIAINATLAVREATPVTSPEGSDPPPRPAISPTDH